ncbi:MAG TPA: S1C family serine protease [Candidatus Polarisedimenticolia bacterium]|nr:S1C family serine protease [Candidatus Polarisedimenticolia bacterium]
MHIPSSTLAVLLVASSLASVVPKPDRDTIPEEVAAAFGAIVSVRVREVVKVPVFRGGRFLREPIEGLGAGSGVIVSADGLILTNAHVVAGSTQVTIAALDGREVGARVVSIDEASDLALLRAEGGPYKPIAFAPDRLPGPGAPLFVLGNRGDRGIEVGWARMGAHARLRAGTRPLEFWAEVLAPIGPGNSGGALVDEAGHLVGMPSLLITYTEEATAASRQASGLFVPARHLRRAMQKMIAGRAPAWPWIGILMDDPLIAQSEGRGWDPQRGATVRRVYSGSPAAEAGLRPGDRVVSVGTVPTPDNYAALDAVLDLGLGKETTVTVERTGQKLLLAVVPAPRPPDPRPEPLDDFALHTGFRLQPRSAGKEGRDTLALAGMSPLTRKGLPEFEAVLFDERPALVSILPGQNALEGQTRRLPALSATDLESIIGRCFVEEQFVALAHWDFDGRKTLDRAHVHRKVYPVVL